MIGPGGTESVGTGDSGDPSLESRKLTMVQLCDSFFPSGGFTLSHGLESWIQQRSDDPGKDEIQQWIEEYLRSAILPNATVILLKAFSLSREGETTEIEALDRFYRSTLSPEERREADLKEGRSIRELIEESMVPEENAASPERYRTWKQLTQQWGTSEGTLPVTLGALGCLFALDEFEISGSYLYSVSRTITGAAMRLGVLNHFEAQQILTAINRKLPGWIEEVKDRGWQRAGVHSPMYRLMAFEHEDADLRLFTT